MTAPAVVIPAERAGHSASSSNAARARLAGTTEKIAEKFARVPPGRWRVGLSGWRKKDFQCAVKVTAAGAARPYYASFRHGLLRIRGEVMKRLLLGGMLAAVIAAPAMAADMPARAPVYKAPPPPV